ncbi:UV-damage endonuclease [Ceratocystis fimbriata CBS 114723]|uniref:UV-damage endonuclease n=1 Tax=Ceratocystis fimbriata CBS 114723 TaxID=1035309 RepID=A0A2C5X052_9PEZI|nr:UV-damage endonuclease [Ceratocystis fimbriata CBS 114723]
MVVTRQSRRLQELVIRPQGDKALAVSTTTTDSSSGISTVIAASRKRPRTSSSAITTKKITRTVKRGEGDSSDGAEDQLPETPKKPSHTAKRVKREPKSDVEESDFEDDENLGGCCESDDDFEFDTPPKKPKANSKQKRVPLKPAKTKKTKKVVVKAEDSTGEPPETMPRLLPLTGGSLPLPWKGRLGYACINTYLRSLNPPIFSGRTCRMASIIEHRHPLQDPSQPEHPTKNRPDMKKPASIERGQRYVEAIGLANARDIIPILRWNDRFGIKFMRLSSDMFPFASHKEYGYPLTPFAAEVLGEVGRTVAELGHRVTTHPGQYTQLGSPRKEVVDSAIRDLNYHDEMLSLLKLPEQADRDAVMIIHLGGTFGDKAATLDRFRANYKRLSVSVKRRLVLENDDVSWSVHDLLPICQELEIPLVLDFHHHSIIFDEEALKDEGTTDVTNLYDRIKETWDRKGIRQKMHYSESRPGAITSRDRRAHSARVKELPPCPPDMDLMIEAKDKEQSVFELMRTYKLDGWEKIKSVVPDDRSDEWAVYWPEGRDDLLKVRKVRKKKSDLDLGVGVDAETEESKAVPEKKTRAKRVSTKKAQSEVDE